MACTQVQAGKSAEDFGAPHPFMLRVLRSLPYRMHCLFICMQSSSVMQHAACRSAYASELHNTCSDHSLQVKLLARDSCEFCTHFSRSWVCGAALHASTRRPAPSTGACTCCPRWHEIFSIHSSHDAMVTWTGADACVTALMSCAHSAGRRSTASCLIIWSSPFQARRRRAFLLALEARRSTAASCRASATSGS